MCLDVRRLMDVRCYVWGRGRERWHLTSHLGTHLSPGRKRVSRTSRGSCEETEETQALKSNWILTNRISIFWTGIMFGKMCPLHWTFRSRQGAQLYCCLLVSQLTLHKRLEGDIHIDSLINSNTVNVNETGGGVKKKKCHMKMYATAPVVKMCLIVARTIDLLPFIC